MNATTNPPVLPRSEAMQMATDLGTAIHNIISLAEQGDDTDKVLALDTLVLLQTKRNVLDCGVMWSKEPAPKPGTVFAEPDGLAEQEHSALQAVEALQSALAAFAAPGERDYAASAKNCGELARAAQIAATELAKTAACYQMARAIGDAPIGGAS